MATTDTPPQPQEVLRWYTRARRIPRLIGKAPGGGHYPGGPYTLTQAAGAAVVLLGGQATMSIWGRFGFWGNNGALVVAVVLTLVALRFVKPGGRDPVTAAMAMLALTGAPTWGKQGGRPVRGGAPRPVLVRHRINARVPDRPGLRHPRPPAQQPEQPAPAPPRSPAASVVQQLLRNTHQEKKT